jgi:hypothetical protein
MKLAAFLTFAFIATLAFAQELPPHQLIFQCHSTEFFKEIDADGVIADRDPVTMPDTTLGVYVDETYRFLYANYEIKSDPAKKVDFAAVETYIIDASSLPTAEFSAALNYMAKMSDNLEILNSDYYTSYRVMDAKGVVQIVALYFYKNGGVIGKVLYHPDQKVVGICQ